MILGHLVLFSLPILLSFSAILILIKFNFFLKLEILEKFIFSLALGSAIFIFLLTLYGIFIPTGFRVFSLILFSLGLLAICLAAFSRIKDVRDFMRKSILGMRKKNFDSIKILFLITFLVYLAKTFLFLIYKPIIDPDVIDSYLPFARSLFLANNIPLRDLFSGRPITIPPVGGFILYAWNYAITGSILSESFRLIPLPFVLGNLALVYLIGREILGEKTALLSSIIFMFLPFQDEALFLNIYYPDFMFLFFCLFFLYLLIKIFRKKKKAFSIYLYLLGLSIAIAFLLKLQAIFLYLFFILIFIKESKNLTMPLKKIIGIMLIIGFFIVPFIFRWFRPYGNPPFWPSLILIGLVVLFFLFYLRGKIEISNKEYPVVTCKNLVKVLLISLVGGIWLLRSLAIFHHPIADLSTDVGKSLIRLSQNISQEIERLCGVPSPTKLITWPKYSWLAIFYWPLLGTFWVVPKFWGLFSMLKQRRGLFLLTWGLGWFCFWQIYLGGVSGNRYLLPLTPVLAWVIAFGIEELSQKIKTIFLRNQKVSVYTIITLMGIFGLLFSLLQSGFLWWNAGVIYYGQTELRNQALEVIPPQTAEALNIFDESSKFSSGSYKENLIILVKKLAVVFSASSELASEYIKELMVAGFLAAPLFLIFLLVLLRIKLTPKVLSGMIISLGAVLILPYFLVFILISEGNLSQFAKLEREKVYSSWGQAKFVEPFLIENAKKNDKILLYGIPTGLSYFTGLRVYNLEYDIAGIEIVSSIIGESDKEKVYSFLEERGIKYFIIDTHGRSFERFTQFKKLTEFAMILEDKEYVEQKIFPSKENAWALYELK